MNDQKLPAVSVIIPVYNVEKYLRQCLDSIIGQTLKEIEIICVNDGSTDGSLAILQEYAAADERIRVYTKDNEGLGGASARNYGLELATGDYISILDSDDFFDAEMLEKMYARAVEADADIVLCGGYEFDDIKQRDMPVTSILNDGAVPGRSVFSFHDCADKIYQISQGMAWNKLYRRTFLERHGIRFQQIKYTDDAYFTFAHMVLAERIAVVRDKFCHYRVNSGRNQTGGLADYPDSSFAPYLKLKGSLVEWGHYDEVKQSFVNCVTAFLRYCYDLIGRYDAFCYLHDRYKNGIFEKLDIAGQQADYFYDERVALWVRQVERYSAGEILFLSAKAYGGNSMTGVLRFPFPYERIPQGSRVVLMGAGIMGRHFYVQNMLSEYCDIVLWVERDDRREVAVTKRYEDIKDAQFDYVLLANIQKDIVEEAVFYLGSIGVAKNKIVYGGQLQ